MSFASMFKDSLVGVVTRFVTGIIFEFCVFKGQKGLSFSSTEKKIVEAFSEFGEVIEAKLVMDKARNRPKGYGFVTFAEKEAAEKACEGMNGKLLDGRAVYVRF